MVENTILNTKKIKRIIGILLILGLKIKRIQLILLILFVFNIVFSTIPADTTRIRGLSIQPLNSGRISRNCRKHNIKYKQILHTSKNPNNITGFGRQCLLSTHSCVDSSVSFLHIHALIAVSPFSTFSKIIIGSGFSKRVIYFQLKSRRFE